MANNDSTTKELNPCMIKDLPNAEQIKSALSDIGVMAEALKALCYHIIEGDEDGHLTVAAAHLATKIGWVADRCLGFDGKSSDDWLMPPTWSEKGGKVKADHLAQN